MVLRSDGGHILSSICYQDCDSQRRKEHQFEEHGSTDDDRRAYRHLKTEKRVLKCVLRSRPR
jgi:hypothetical protein